MIIKVLRDSCNLEQRLLINLSLIYLNLKMLLNKTLIDINNINQVKKNTTNL